MGTAPALASGLDREPSELIRQQIYMNFWYERAGIDLRHVVGMDNIMWESDFPHFTSTYPTHGSSSSAR